jgi:hypothetical protein
MNMRSKTKETKQQSTNGPALIAYQVTAGKDGGKAFWQRCGAAWPNKKGGFQLRLNTLPLGGDLVLLPPSAGNTEGGA